MTLPADIRIDSGAERTVRANARLPLSLLLFLGFAPVAVAPVLAVGLWADQPVAPGIAAIALLATGLASRGVARLLTRPIDDMAIAMRRLAAGELEARMIPLPARTPREFAALGATFDRMAESVRHGRSELAATALREQTANRAKSEFLANMSHEFRTPLNAIIGFAELVQRQLYGPIGNARYISCVGDIHASGMHLLTMINEVLDLAKAESGRMDVQYEPVSLPDIIEQSVRMVRPRAATKCIAIEIDMPSGMPAIESDELKLRQVLINLLSNAVKFTGEGGVVRVAAGLDGGTALLRVSDTGIGIPQADLARVLEPFCQVKDPHGRQTEGTGLGLPLAKKLVEIMGGTLFLSSQPGLGTTVEFSVPRSRVRSLPERKAA